MFVMASLWKTDSSSKFGLERQLKIPHRIIRIAMMKKMPERNLIELKSEM